MLYGPSISRILLLCLSCQALANEPQTDLEKAIQTGNFKQAIAIEKQDIQQAPQKDKGKLLDRLALLYLKDQDQESAFAAFIESLEQKQTQSAPPNFSDSDPAYKDALAIYMAGQAENPQISAQKLIEKYAQKLKEQKEPSPIGFLVAAAYANLCLYEEFFNFFYDAYASFPNHFLAYKTKALLHVKLMERRRSEPERRLQREAILQNLNAALALEPQDTTLYKLLITFSFPESIKEQIQRCLKKILDGNMIIPRSELQFYVQETVDIKDYDLAQRFLDRAREWYPNSRIVSTAQNYLNAQKGH